MLRNALDAYPRRSAHRERQVMADATKMEKLFNVDSMQPKPARACASCLFRERNKCGATGFYIRIERGHAGLACGREGKLWRAKPLREIGAIQRAWRYLFGGPDA
jgi:hypothetical protein